jgi:hypothetical protein
VTGRTPPLDLGRRRTLGELIVDAVRLFMLHLSVFLSVTLLVVTPVVLLVDGIWGRALADGIDADAPLAADIASALLSAFVIPPLVTALHVVIVLGLARGVEPSVSGALRTASERFLPAVGTVFLAALGVALGLLLLVLPGIWLGVRWYLGAQAAVVDRLSPVAALRRSAELVRDRWWRTFGFLVVAGLAFGVLVGVPGAILGALASELSGALYVATVVVVQAVTLSLTALFGTLLFFDLRARRELSWEGTAPADPTAPERPVGA